MNMSDTLNYLNILPRTNDILIPTIRYDPKIVMNNIRNSLSNDIVAKLLADNILNSVIDKYDSLKIRHKTVKRIKRHINKLSKRVKKLNKKYGENSKEASFISKRMYVFYVYQSYASWLGLAKMFYCTSIINKINKKLKELYVTNPKDGKSIMKKILSNPYIPNKVIKDSINIAIWNNLLTANIMEK